MIHVAEDPSLDTRTADERDVVFEFTITLGGPITEEQAKDLAWWAERFVSDEQEHHGSPGFVCGEAEGTVRAVPV